MTEAPFIDCHCHLDLFPGISTNPSSESRDGIKTITVTNAPYLFEPNNKLFASQDDIRVALGLHPELVARFNDQIELFNHVISETKYIGEIGLDGSKQHYSTFELQIQTLEKILMKIKETDRKILSVHSRNAAKQTISTISKFLSSNRNAIILHWFSGTLSEAKMGLDAGYYFSVNHKMIDSSKGVELVKLLPAERILTETDAPFTLNQQIRTRKDSLTYCLSGIAKIKGWSDSQAKQIVFGNFKIMLNKAAS